jgi:DNA-binding protein Fis
MGPTLLPEFLPIELQTEPAGDAELSSEIADVGSDAWRELGDFFNQALTEGHSDLYRETLQRFDHLVVMEAMRRARGLQSHAAELLALSRPTVRAKLRMLSGAQNSSIVTDLQSPPEKT